MRVTQATRATRGHDDALSIMREVGYLIARFHRAGIELTDNRTHGDLQHEVATIGTVLFGALAMRARLGAEVVLEPIIDKRGKLGIGLDDDVSAVTAVAAVRAAFGHKRLAAERHAARAAVAALDVDAANVGELGHGAPSL